MCNKFLPELPSHIFPILLELPVIPILVPCHLNMIELISDGLVVGAMLSSSEVGRVLKPIPEAKLT